MIYIFIGITILIYIFYKYIYSYLYKSRKSTFWNRMPVMQFDKDYIKNLSIIDHAYGYSMPDQTNISIFDIEKDIDDVLDFLNQNYIEGYIISKDYINRKMAIPKSIGIIYRIDNKIIGFIQSSPYTIFNQTFNYVDLLCVSYNYRNKGIAKLLIENIIFYSPFKICLHKKDKYELPFKHFYKSSHYSCGIAYLKNKYGLNKTLYEPYIIEDSSIPNIFTSSETIKTYKYNDNYISFSIHKFHSIGYITIAEVFYLSPNFKDYLDIITIMHDNKIDFMVVLPNGIFKERIDIDNYSKSMDLYIYSFNFVIHPIDTELWINIP